MIGISLDIDGTRELDRAFNRVNQFISDFRNFWPDVTREIYGIERKQFDTQGAAGQSGRWAALSPAYAKYKAIKFPGEPILRATGGLEASLTDPQALDAIYRPEKDQLTIGSKHPGAIHHQRGTGRMPARPPFSLTENNKRTIQKSIQKGLVKFARDLGFQTDERAA